MKIAVVNNWVPFIRGGAEHLAEAVTGKLNEYGHEAILVKLPFRWHPPEKILEHMLACRSMRLANCDRVIAMKFPAYYLPHPNKVLWLVHQFRQVYELWGTPYQDLPNKPEALRIRDAIIQMDNCLFAECQRIYTNSHVTADRLHRFNGPRATVLFPPLASSTHFYCKEYGDYVFYPSRITAGKRQHLLVEAMRYVRSGVKLVIAGNPETAQDLARIESVIREARLQDRVRLVPRFISETEKADFLAGALACAYAPYDEDSYGYVTLEACCARKPVLTCTDSGGTLILVEEGVTGSVTPPDAKSIAEVMDRLYADKAHAQRMGEAAHERMLELNITWDHVIRCLTE